MRRLVPGPAVGAALPGNRTAPRPEVLTVAACALLAACGGDASPAARTADYRPGALSRYAAGDALMVLTRSLYGGPVITADRQTARIGAGGPVSLVSASRPGKAAGSMAAPAGHLAPGTDELHAHRHAERCLDVAAEPLRQAPARAHAIGPVGPTATSPANGRGF